jgi:hypothetical protein
MVDAIRPTWTLRAGVLALLTLGVVPGCSMVPRERVDESVRLTQSLRAENARLKDDVLSLQTQNRDYSDRALDDLRRLTAREEAIERLERSVQAYQDDRDRLASSYRRLAMSLGRTPEESSSPLTGQRPGPPGGFSPAARGGRRDGGETESVWGDGDRDADAPSSRPSSNGSGP